MLHHVGHLPLVARRRPGPAVGVTPRTTVRGTACAASSTSRVVEFFEFFEFFEAMIYPAACHDLQRKNR